MNLSCGGSLIEKSKLKDLDLDHPFFSDEAIKKWKNRIKELIEEEKAETCVLRPSKGGSTD